MPLDTRSSGVLLFAKIGMPLDTTVERVRIHQHEIISTAMSTSVDGTNLLWNLPFSATVPPSKNVYMANDLEPYENITRVFWIKIELKDNQLKGRQDLGDIKDVMSGEKSRIKELLDIIDFIIPYIEKMGIRISWFWRLTIWMKRNRKINLRK